MLESRRLPLSSISENLAVVRSRIDAAARRTGRDPAGVRLVVVTKLRALEEIEEVVRLGELHLGENRIQEARARVEEVGRRVGPARPVWHLIGHVQTNKAKMVPVLFDMVHSVDSVRVAESLSEACAKQGREGLDVLVQVNVSGEESKSGFAPGETEAALCAMAALPRLRVRGLMTMAPFEAEAEATRPVFRGLRELRDALRSLNIPNLSLEELSMGMTNDFEVAVEEGATYVRIGTAVFEGFRPSAC